MTLNIATFKSALVSTVLMAFVTVAVYVIGLGDIWKIDLHTIVNLAVISLLTGLVSIIKNMLTNENGTFAGILQVK